MKKVWLYTLFVFLTVPVASAKWVMQSTGVKSNFFGVWFTSPTNGWVVGMSGTFMQTTDGGKTWLQGQGLPQQFLYQQDNLNKIMFTDPSDGWIVGDHNVIFSTNDSGRTWQYVPDGVPYVSDYYGIFDLKESGKNSLWISGGRNTSALTAIEKLTPAGYWAPQIMGFAGRLVRLYFYNDSLGWAVGDSGLILATTNGGTWWNEQQSHTKLGLNDVAFFNPDTGVCIGTDGLIFRTTDGGAVWKQISYTQGVILFRLARVGGSTAYAVGTGNTILKSTDQGATWEPQTDDAPATTEFEDVFFLNDSTAWAVGHDGIIVHLGNSDLASVKSTQPGPYSFELEQNYPNPFNPSTMIRYSLPRSEFVTLTIYNSIGQQVRTLVSREESAGTHSVAFDASGLSSGVYFYRLEAGKYVSTKKLAVLK